MNWNGLVSHGAVAAAALLAATLAGCALPSAGSGIHAKKPHRLAKSEPQRKQELVENFEQRRDQAQLGAALDRWKQGDSAGSEALLLQLLARNPQNREARRALADLYAARPDPAAALEQLHELLDQSPDDAQAHHSLGLVLETLKRREEALRHFERALALDPRNEIYLLSRDTCRDED